MIRKIEHIAISHFHYKIGRQRKMGTEKHKITTIYFLFIKIYQKKELLGTNI